MSKKSFNIIGGWWKDNTVPSERQTWAVLDIHHYIAWDTSCNNIFYTYGINTEDGLNRIKQCSTWFSAIRGSLGLSSNDQLSASEFSASTNSDTLKSGSSGKSTSISVSNSKIYRNTFVEEEVKNAKVGNIKAIFWTWMIPNNSNFQQEWSLFDICNSSQNPSICVQ